MNAPARTRPVVDPSKEEMYTIKSSPDPTGTGDIGIASTIRPQRMAVTLVRYQDILIEIDLYASQDKDHPGKVEAMLYCPRCRNQLRVGPERKRISFDLEAAPAWVATAGLLLSEPIIASGRLDIEVFGCTWEIDGGKTVGGRDNNLCRWRVAIDNNVAKDA